uniref:Host defense peptide odorranain-M-OM n=1 Tax=Odorrana margaretae TaxID=121156 RepID=A0A067XKT0_ODOMA|nr:host defense peptide odorranain-M-OM [Odorrana margaretae]
MFTLKKFLLLLFFLGIVSSSPCLRKRDADEEGNEENGGEAKLEDIKRATALVLPPRGLLPIGFKFKDIILCRKD